MLYTTAITKKQQQQQRKYRINYYKQLYRVDQFQELRTRRPPACMRVGLHIMKSENDRPR